MRSPPKIDRRKFADLLNEIRQLVPYYTPEWLVSDDESSDSALLKIFAGMLAGTLEQLNQVPQKNFIAFLEMLGVKLFPAQQSRVPITFYLSEGTTKTVLIPAKTTISAQPIRGGDSIVFETENNILATPSRLINAYSVNKKEDSIFPAPPGFLERERLTPVFAKLIKDANQGDTSLFIDNTSEIKPKDILKLKKFSNNEYLEIENISGKKVYIKEKLSNFYSSNTTVEKVIDFELFSGKNKQEHILYLGHSDIFNITASVQIILEISSEISDVQEMVADEEFVQWQYWGENQETQTLGWFDFEDYEIINNQIILVKNNNHEIKETEINRIRSRWIRCVAFNLAENQSLAGIEIDTIKVTATPLEISDSSDVTEASTLDYCLTFNNLQYQNKTEENKTTGIVFIPFESPEDLHQSLYLGFDAPLLEGALSIFFSLEIQPYTDKNRPQLDWEYYRRRQGKGEWVALEVQDRTNSLTQSGTVEFTGSPDFAQVSRFGKSLYWIRVVDVDNKFKPEKDINSKVILQNFAPTPKIKGIYLNTTWASQTETIKNKILGSSNGKAEQIFSFPKSPVIYEEIWVNELSALSTDEMETLSYQRKVKEVRDGEGNIREFWVKWESKQELLESKADERHYEIDRTFGRVKFGNGTEGKIPPIGVNNIITDYQIGGGKKSNIGRFGINSLTSSIAYIDSVSNPEPAEGGTDTELLEKALVRGSQILKHRNRAVTAADFEQLTYQASRSIARVKCLPNFNDRGKYQLGWVTVIAIPNSSKSKPKPSLLLRQQVEKYLHEHAANVVTSPKHLRVSGAMYVEVTIETKLVANDIDAILDIKAEAMQKLNSFLHPLTGGNCNQGWEFGRLPHLSDFYALLGSISDLERIESLEMNIENDDTNLPPYALVSSGKHLIYVTARNISEQTII